MDNSIAYGASANLGMSWGEIAGYAAAWLFVAAVVALVVGPFLAGVDRQLNRPVVDIEPHQSGPREGDAIVAGRVPGVRLVVHAHRNGTGA